MLCLYLERHNSTEIENTVREKKDKNIFLNVLLTK